MTVIVDRQNLEIVAGYPGLPNQANWAKPWGDPSLFAHIELNEGMDVSCVKASHIDGEITVDVDADKTAAKVANQWIAMRRQRDEKLSACDYTQLGDAPYTAPQKAAWRSYRQALRDLPEETEDPTNPEWPSEPS